MEARTSPAQPGLFQNETTFRQFPNGSFSPNLATTHETITPRNVPYFRKFLSRCHLPPPPLQKLSGRGNCPGEICPRGMFGSRNGVGLRETPTTPGDNSRCFSWSTVYESRSTVNIHCRCRSVVAND